MRRALSCRSGIIRASGQRYSDKVSVLGLKAEFCLPLCETYILVDDHSTEDSFLDERSQVVVIREDLAGEVGAKINAV